jgi:hypothetical protein
MQVRSLRFLTVCVTKARHGCNPEGIESLSPGLRGLPSVGFAKEGTSYPGNADPATLNPQPQPSTLNLNPQRPPGR